MKRWVVLPVAAALLASIAWSDTPPPAGAARLRQLHRNRRLVDALVNGGLRLAAEPDPLKRAECCHGLAENLAGEIGQAATDHDSARVAELGRHLQSVLQEGVADNLHDARRLIPPGSAREAELRRVGRRAADGMKPLEEQLRHATAADAADLRGALAAVDEGRAEVEKAFQVANPPGEHAGPR